MSTGIAAEGIVLEQGEKKKSNAMNVDVEEQSRHLYRDVADPTGQIHWHTGFKARFPWLGFLALFTMFLCIISSIVILTTSNNKAKEEWPVHQRWYWINDKWKQRAQFKPNDALALTNTVANIAITIAIGNGVSIAWWRRALKGATVADLHRSWAFSHSVFDLLTAGRHFNMVALAALTAKLALVDNILLQRATGTAPGTWWWYVDDLQLPIVPELPQGWAGTFGPGNSLGALSGPFTLNLWGDMSFSGTITFDSMWNDGPGIDTKCRGACYAMVQGFGFNVSCTAPVATDVFVNRTSMLTVGKDGINQTSSDELLVFSLSAQGVSAGERVDLPGQSNVSIPYDAIALTIYNTNTANDPDEASVCNGTQLSHVCYLQPAVLEYPIAIVNKTNDDLVYNGVEMNMPDDPSMEQGQLSKVKVVRVLTTGQTANVYSIAHTINNLYQGESKLRYSPETGYRTTGEGPLAEMWVVSENLMRSSFSCALTMTDPGDWLIGELNFLMLRASISAAIEPRFMGPAIGIMLLCILGVLPTYYGFWELGRKVTLGPVEIASAFQAPILEHPAAAGRGEVDEVLKQVGDRRLRYGDVQGTGRLGMAEPELVMDIGQTR